MITNHLKILVYKDYIHPKIQTCYFHQCQILSLLAKSTNKIHKVVWRLIKNYLLSYQNNSMGISLPHQLKEQRSVQQWQLAKYINDWRIAYLVIHLQYIHTRLPRLRSGHCSDKHRNLAFRPLSFLAIVTYTQENVYGIKKSAYIF